MSDRLTSALDWVRDGADWPNRAASRFVTAGGLRWHVQVAGAGPVLLLLHGTGASTHSFRDLLPILAGRVTVIAPDLPGHGFTSMAPPAGLSTAGMAHGVAELLTVLDIQPALIVGHSAGAALAVRMALDGLATPVAIVGLNAALLGFRGLPARVFSPAARALAGCGAVPRLVSLLAGDRAGVARLIRDTGSTIDDAGLDQYARLVRSPGHIAGALGMMANWQLGALEADLPRLAVPLTLIAGRADRTVPPAQALRVRNMLPGTRVELLTGLGHLAHEEAPALVAALILSPQAATP